MILVCDQNIRKRYVEGKNFEEVYQKGMLAVQLWAFLFYLNGVLGFFSLTTFTYIIMKSYETKTTLVLVLAPPFLSMVQPFVVFEPFESSLVISSHQSQNPAVLSQDSW